MRWNLKKPRTGLNLSYHFPWSSQMLAVLLWIAKPVWQYCLPFSKHFFQKKCQKTVVFVHFFNNQKNSSNRKRLFLAPKERSFYLQSPHPGLFSCVFQSKTIQAEYLGGKISCNTYCYFALLKEKRGLPQSSSFKKSVYFLELFLFSLCCSSGPRFAFKNQ